MTQNSAGMLRVAGTAGGPAWKESFRGGWELEENNLIYFILIDPKTGKINSTEIWFAEKDEKREINDLKMGSFTKCIVGENEKIEIKEMNKEEIKEYKKRMNEKIKAHPDVRVRTLVSFYVD